MRLKFPRKIIEPRVLEKKGLFICGHFYPVDSGVTNQRIRFKLTARTDDPKTCASQNHLANLTGNPQS